MKVRLSLRPASGLHVAQVRVRNVVYLGMHWRAGEAIKRAQDAAELAGYREAKNVRA